MSNDIDYSYNVLEASYAANSAALAIGGVFFVPLAIVIGRRFVYMATCLVMFACAIWSARTETAVDVIATNIVMGLVASVTESLFLLTVRKRCTPKPN